MNTFRTISRVLVVAAVVVASNVFASQPDQYRKPILRPLLKNAARRSVNFVFDHKYAGMATAWSELTFDKHDDAKKAAVQTLGYICDREEGNRHSKDKEKQVITPEELAAHFGINLVVHKAAKKLNEQGISVKAAGNVCKKTYATVVNTCDVLPTEGIMRNAANFVGDYIVTPAADCVVIAAEFATNPEVITVAVLKQILPYINNK